MLKFEENFFLQKLKCFVKYIYRIRIYLQKRIKAECMNWKTAKGIRNSHFLIKIFQSCFYTLNSDSKLFHL